MICDLKFNLCNDDAPLECYDSTFKVLILVTIPVILHNLSVGFGGSLFTNAWIQDLVSLVSCTVLYNFNQLVSHKSQIGQKLRFDLRFRTSNQLEVWHHDNLLLSKMSQTHHDYWSQNLDPIFKLVIWLCYQLPSIIMNTTKKGKCVSLSSSSDGMDHIRSLIISLRPPHTCFKLAHLSTLFSMYCNSNNI